MVSKYVDRLFQFSKVLVVVIPMVALTPVVHIVVDWVDISRVMGTSDVLRPPRGFDWTLWQDDNGQIRATYVFPSGSAARAGLMEKDTFFQLDYQQYFTAADLRRAVEGIQPGTFAVYSVYRDGQILDIPVRITRYPTFLYPLSGVLWQFSMWSFLLGAYLHILGLIIAIPLVRRSKQARFSLLLIGVSAIWMFTNAARLILVELAGPPLSIDSFYDHFFIAFTIFGLFGWIGFPALLLLKIVLDAHLHQKRRKLVSGYILLPALILGVITIISATYGSVGPFTLDGLVAPVLFYASFYIAAASAIVLMLHVMKPESIKSIAGNWNRSGSLLTLFLALVPALFVLGFVPSRGAMTDITAGWMIVFVQLLSIAPVILVSLSTLKYGKLDEVLQRGLIYLTVLGLFFFLFVGGSSLIDYYLNPMHAPRNVLLGAYVVLLMLLFERLARRARVYVESFITTERQRTRNYLARFQKEMRSIFDLETLTRRAVDVLGTAFNARFSALVLYGEDGTDPVAVFNVDRTDTQVFSERLLTRVWPHIRREVGVWAQTPELDESSLPEEVRTSLEKRGTVVALPISGDATPIGIIALGQKRNRRSVYNLEDIEALRTIGGQLGLAVERLRLLEREKALIRQHAEAQLVALRAQINPHFLFNALNTVVSLISEKPDEAERVVEQLAFIFRQVLKIGSNTFVTLEEEMSLVSNYLQIEQARFGHNLQVEIQVDPGTRNVPVPAFAVQTLVENAVKHGIERRRGGGLVRITATMRNEAAIEISVFDTGSGIPALFDTATGPSIDKSFYGIGLQNVSTRLEQLYGQSGLLQITSKPDSGTLSQLFIPIHRTETATVVLN